MSIAYNIEIVGYFRGTRSIQQPTANMFRGVNLCVTVMFVWTFTRTAESFPNNNQPGQGTEPTITEVMIIEGEELSENPLELDYDPLALEGWEGRNGTGGCGECVPELCPEALGCRAGLVLDACGCCRECGNLEGQSCDLDGGEGSVFYGPCGEGLRCVVEAEARGPGEGEVEVAEPLCACRAQDALCGSDGRTYLNPCQFREAAFSNQDLKVKSQGPCHTVPIIKVRPQPQVCVRGSSVVLLCEVGAFPPPLVEWTKEGRDIILPGDDPHISVQSRGGPLRFELSSWLQIEAAALEDAGSYRCLARNHLGTVEASAVVGVLGADEMEVYLSENMADLLDYHPSLDYEEDYY